MKNRILFLLVALMATMSLSAQTFWVYKNSEVSPVATYSNSQEVTYRVKTQGGNTLLVYKNDGSEPVATYQNTEGTTYRVVMNNEVPIVAFSVSATKKVLFTKGNLQATYNGSTGKYTWGFAANQWDCVGGSSDGEDNLTGNNTIQGQKAGAVVDLFCWSTNDYRNYGITNNQSDEDYEGDFVNWSTLFPGDNYSLLSGSEWNYLLKTRTVNGGTGEGHSYQRTTLTLSDGTTVYGMLIAPDYYTGTLSGSTSWSDWQTMESADVVFLPAAGKRDGELVGDVGSKGLYWSSDRGTIMNFRSGYVGKTSCGVYYGCSVRLVTEVSKK